MSWLRSIFDSRIKSSGALACSFIGARHPEFIVNGVSLRAREAERFVFAVFYLRASLPARPSSYCIVAVTRDSDEISELPLSPDSRYWITGRK